jgi:hypothetical protein
MSCFSEPIDDGSCSFMRKKRCPLHKHIRTQNWSSVMSQMRFDPSLIARRNGVGWSSLILAIYHGAPIDVIAEMLHLCDNINKEEEDDSSLLSLLSQTVPTGDRLCLHFATRFCTSLEVLKLLTEPYPRALLRKSTDGATPLDRAIYYRKDKAILKWLETATKEEEAVYELEQYNVNLKRQIQDACELNRVRGYANDNNEVQQRHHQQLSEKAKFVVKVYTYTKEREMIGLFDNVMSYVGVQELPREAKRKVEFVTKY